MRSPCSWVSTDRALRAVSMGQWWYNAEIDGRKGRAGFFYFASLRLVVFSVGERTLTERIFVIQCCILYSCKTKLLLKFSLGYVKTVHAYKGNVETSDILFCWRLRCAGVLCNALSWSPRWIISKFSWIGRFSWFRMHFNIRVSPLQRRSSPPFHFIYSISFHLLVP